MTKYTCATAPEEAVGRNPKGVHSWPIALELAEELATGFSLPELRYERDIAYVNTHPDLDDYPYWVWYSRAVDEAIDLLRMVAPAPARKHDHIDIDAVRARADIIALAEDYGLHLSKSGRNFKTNCPFHNDKTPSCVLYPSENRFHCYGCQADGDAITFVMKMDGVDFKSACHRVEGI